MHIQYIYINIILIYIKAISPLMIFRSTGMSSCHGSTRAGALHPCSREHASSRGAYTLWLRRLDVSAWAWMREFQWCCSTWLCWRIGIGGVELFPLCFILRQSESVYGPSMVRSLLVFPWYIVSSPLV